MAARERASWCWRRRPVGVDDGALLQAEGGQSPASDEEKEHWWFIACGLLKMASLMFLGLAAFVVMKSTDTALLGYTGKEYLEAVSLGDLWNSATGVFIQSGAIGVFCSNAVGQGNRRMVGVWLQVSYAVLAVVCLAVATSWACTGPVLRALGRDEVLADDAQYFALVLMLCMPVRIAFSQLNLAFMSMRIVKPGSMIALLSMLLNLALGLVLVRGIPFRDMGFKGYGFVACPWVTVFVEYVQFTVFWIYTVKCRALHTEWWPGFSYTNITWPRVKEFLGQYVYQSLSLASDFWRVSALGMIASSLGNVNVAVFNTSYRICWIVLIFCACIAQAMGINIGIALGAGHPEKAWRQARIGMGMALVFLLLLCVSVALAPRMWGQIFTDDKEILDVFEASRYSLTAFVGLMNLSVVLEKIPLAVGRPRIAFWMGVVGSWVGQVPGAFLAIHFLKRDLASLYWGSACGYALLCVLLAIAIIRLDWDVLCDEARQRAEAHRTAPPTASPPSCATPEAGDPSPGAQRSQTELTAEPPAVDGDAQVDAEGEKSGTVGR